MQQELTLFQWILLGCAWALALGVFIKFLVVDRRRDRKNEE
jgi:hypothetical protein